MPLLFGAPSIRDGRTLAGTWMLQRPYLIIRRYPFARTYIPSTDTNARYLAIELPSRRK